MKLRELSQAQQVISDMLEENGGEINEEIAQMIEAASEGEKNNVDWFGTMLAQAKADSDAFSFEIKRLQDRKKTLDNKSKRLRDYFLSYMLQQGADKMEGELYKVRVHNANAVNVTDSASLIGEAEQQVADIMAVRPWLNIKIEVSKAYLKDMEQMPEGAEITTSTSAVFR